MGSNPNYNPAITDDWIKQPPLSTWQKVVLGIAGGAEFAVVAAPLAAAGPEIAAACLANPAGCASVVADVVTGGADGGSTPPSDAGKAVTQYRKSFANRQNLNMHIPHLVTPGGRSLSLHAAERVAGSGPGRPPTNLRVVDYILDNANKVKYNAETETIQVRATQLPGKPYVAVRRYDPDFVVTVMIPKEIKLP